MTTLSNLELIAKKRVEAFKKANKTITEIYQKKISPDAESGVEKKVKND